MTSPNERRRPEESAPEDEYDDVTLSQKGRLSVGGRFDFLRK